MLVDWGLFVAGAAGALLTVYLAAKEVVPDFPPIMETEDQEDQLLECEERLTATNRRIQELQAELKSPEDELALEALRTALASEEDERDVLMSSKDRLDGRIGKSRAISRAMGFVVFVLFGGLIASYVSNQIELEDIPQAQTALADGLKAFVIGGAWTSFLATIGYRTGAKRVDRRIEKLGRGATNRLKELEEQIEELLAEKPDEETDPTKRKSAEELKKERAQKAKDAVKRAQTDMNTNLGGLRAAVDKSRRALR